MDKGKITGFLAEAGATNNRQRALALGVPEGVVAKILQYSPHDGLFSISDVDARAITGAMGVNPFNKAEIRLISQRRRPARIGHSTLPIHTGAGGGTPTFPTDKELARMKSCPTCHLALSANGSCGCYE
jgi:hypothetical protein